VEPTTEQPIEDAVETPPPVEEAQSPLVDDDDTGLDPEFASQVIEVPDSSAQDGKVKLVPLPALTGARREVKELKQQLSEAKEGSAKAQQLEQKIAQLEGQLSQYAPVVQAYQALLATQPQTSTAPAQDPERLAEIEATARDLDLYTPDAKPDMERAARIYEREERRAAKIAKQAIAPIEQQSVTHQSRVMLDRAKNTAHNGLKADPAVLEALWARTDPSVTATAEGAKWLFATALGLTSLAGAQAPAASEPTPRDATGKFTAQKPGEPLFVEKAGGKDPGSHLPLSDAEKRYIKDQGMTEADYFKSTPPWMRR